jgi:hypothetical protein
MPADSRGASSVRSERCGSISLPGVETTTTRDGNPSLASLWTHVTRHTYELRDDFSPPLLMILLLVSYA